MAGLWIPTPPHLLGGDFGQSSFLNRLMMLVNTIEIINVIFVECHLVLGMLMVEAICFPFLFLSVSSLGQHEHK